MNKQPEKKFVSVCCGENYSVLNRARSIIAADLFKICSKCRKECEAIEVPSPVVSEWEKEFMDDFCFTSAEEEGDSSYLCFHQEVDPEDVLSFIRSLRNQTLEQANSAIQKVLLKKARTIDYADDVITEYDEAARICASTIRSLKS